jgi:hypothetical protein
MAVNKSYKYRVQSGISDTTLQEGMNKSGAKSFPARVDSRKACRTTSGHHEAGTDRDGPGQ